MVTEEREIIRNGNMRNDINIEEWKWLNKNENNEGLVIKNMDNNN